MNIDRYSSIVRKWSPVAGLVSTAIGMIRPFLHIAQSSVAPRFSELLPYVGETTALAVVLLLLVNVLAFFAALRSQNG